DVPWPDCRNWPAPCDLRESATSLYPEAARGGASRGPHATASEKGAIIGRDPKPDPRAGRRACRRAAPRSQARAIRGSASRRRTVLTARLITRKRNTLEAPQ